MPNFHNEGLPNFHFNNTNLPFQTPLWELKCQNEQQKGLYCHHVAQNLLPKKWHFGVGGITQ